MLAAVLYIRGLTTPHLTTHSSLGGRSGCFKIFAPVNNATTCILTHLLVCTCETFPDWYTGKRCLVMGNRSDLPPETTLHCFPGDCTRVSPTCKEQKTLATHVTFITRHRQTSEHLLIQGAQVWVHGCPSPGNRADTLVLSTCSVTRPHTFRRFPRTLLKEKCSSWLVQEAL